eukprot:gene3894-9163_t
MYGGAPVQENITVLGGRHDGARIYTPRGSVDLSGVNLPQLSPRASPRTVRAAWGSEVQASPLIGRRQPAHQQHQHGDPPPPMMDVAPARARSHSQSGMINAPPSPRPPRPQHHEAAGATMSSSASSSFQPPPPQQQQHHQHQHAPQHRVGGRGASTFRAHQLSRPQQPARDTQDMYLLGAPEIDMVAGIREELADAQTTIGQQAAEISRLQQQTDQDAYLSEACRSMERSYNMVKAQAMELEEERPSWQAEVDRLGSQVQQLTAASAAEAGRQQGQLEQAAADRAAEGSRFEAERRASEDALAKATQQLAEAAAAHQQVAKSRDALNLELEDRLVELGKARDENEAVAEQAKTDADAAEQVRIAEKASLDARIASLEQEVKQAASRATAAESERDALKLASEMQSSAQATALKEAGEQAAELRDLVETRVKTHAQEIAAAAASMQTAESAFAAARAAAAETAVAQAAETVSKVAAAAADASNGLKAAVEQASATLQKAIAAAAGSNMAASDVRPAVLACLAVGAGSDADTDNVWAHSTLARLAKAVAQLPFGNAKADLELQFKADRQLLAQIQTMRDKALEAYGNVRSLETRVSVTSKELDQRIEEITELKMAASAQASVAELQDSAESALVSSGQREAALTNQVAELTAAVHAAEEAAATADARASATEAPAVVPATPAQEPAAAAEDSARILELEDDLWTRSAQVQDLEGQVRMLRSQQNNNSHSDGVVQALRVQLDAFQAEASATSALLAAKEADLAKLTTALQEKHAASTSTSSPPPSPHSSSPSPAAVAESIAEKEGELKMAKAEVSKHLDAIERLEAQVAELTAERGSPSDEQIASGQLKSVKTTLQKKEREVARLSAVLTDVKSQADNDLKERIHTLQTALSTSEAAAAEAIAAQKKNKMDTATELATLRSTLKHNDAALRELTEGQDMAATAVQQGAKLRQEIADLEKKLAALEESLAAEQAKVAAMEEGAAAEAAAAADALQAGAAAAQNSAERTKLELKTAKDQLSKTVTERDELKDALKKTTTELKQTSDRLAEATGAIEGNAEEHIKLRQLVMRRYERTVATVWSKVADGKELEFEANIIDNPIDRDADPTREWNNHCSELDKMLLKGVEKLAIQIANFPQELEKVKEVERQELNRVKRLHSDQADRLKTKIKRSQETLENFDGSLSELEAIKQKAEADAAKLARAQSDLSRVTKKLEEQRAQVVAIRDRLDDEKQLVQQLTRQVAAGRAPQTRALPVAVAAPAQPEPQAMSPTRAQDRTKSQKIKERLTIVANDSKDFRKKNAKLITTLRRENATHKLESTKASAKVDVINHRLEKEKEQTKKLSRRLSLVDVGSSLTKKSTNA